MAARSKRPGVRIIRAKGGFSVLNLKYELKRMVFSKLGKAFRLGVNQYVVLEKPSNVRLFYFKRGPCCVLIVQAVKNNRVVREAIMHADFGSAQLHQAESPKSMLNRMLREIKKVKPDYLQASLVGGTDLSTGGPYLKRLLETRNVRIMPTGYLPQTTNTKIFYDTKRSILVVVPLQGKHARKDRAMLLLSPLFAGLLCALLADCVFLHGRF